MWRRTPKDLLLPEEVYLKFQRRGKDEDSYLLGFLTPFDKDKDKFKDRKGTVDSWASRKKGSILDNQAYVAKNEPMEGFRLLHCVSRSRTENKVWRVEDPRGFQLEIMSENLEYLLDHVDIVDREMKGTLVWTTRVQGKTNWLVPEGSDLHEEAKRMGRARGEKLSLRDVNRGDVVLLHDGRKVRYFGGFYFPYDSGYSRRDGTKIVRHYMFEVLGGQSSTYNSRNTKGVLDHKSSVKVGEVVEAAEKPLSKKEAEEAVNALLHTFDHDKRWNKPPRFVCASPFEMEDVTYKRDGEGRQKICVNGREYKDWSDLWWSEEHA